MMNPRSYSSNAIVLKRSNFSEADRILTLYTKHYGKLTVIAKGVRKPKSKKRGSIEVFSLLKFSAARGKNIDILTEVELLEAFTAIRKSLKRSSLAYYFVEVVNKIVQDGDKNDKLYDFLSTKLEALKTSNNLKDLKEEYIQGLLVMLGYWPEKRKNLNPDAVLEEVLERELSSNRVGKKLLT